MSFFSFFDISLETANKFYSWGWKASLVGAAITLLGVSLLMWGTRVRDHDFESQMGELNITAAKANERTALLEKNNIELQTILERERTARLKLEAQIAPRSLSTSQISAFSHALNAIPKPLKAEITILGDQEAKMYGEQILSVLQNADIQLRVNRAGLYTPPPYGIRITLPTNGDKNSLIKDAFGHASIPVEFRHENIVDFDMKIRVGLKPIK